MQNKINYLRKKANKIRWLVLKTAFETKKGHIGGTFSCVDILTTLYYGKIFNFKPWHNRDRFVVGKGHICLGLYHIWNDLGFLSDKRLLEYGKNNSSLGGQLNIDTPGAEYNSGSLGHAVGVAAGMALAAKADCRKYKIFVLIGDGECAEGSIWESASFASACNLNNLVCIVDYNKLSVTDKVEDEKLAAKFEAFGWKSFRINGHSFRQILSLLRRDLGKYGKPVVIVADTVKGKGVSFMEEGIKWHHSMPNLEEYKLAMAELESKE